MHVTTEFPQNKERKSDSHRDRLVPGCLQKTLVAAPNDNHVIAQRILQQRNNRAFRFQPDAELRASEFRAVSRLNDFPLRQPDTLHVRAAQPEQRDGSRFKIPLHPHPQAGLKM